MSCLWYAKKLSEFGINIHNLQYETESILLLLSYTPTFNTWTFMLSNTKISKWITPPKDHYKGPPSYSQKSHQSLCSQYKIGFSYKSLGYNLQCWLDLTFCFMFQFLKVVGWCKPETVKLETGNMVVGKIWNPKKNKLSCILEMQVNYRKKISKEVKNVDRHPFYGYCKLQTIYTDWQYPSTFKELESKKRKHSIW